MFKPDRSVSLQKIYEVFKECRNVVPNSYNFGYKPERTEERKSIDEKTIVETFEKARFPWTKMNSIK